jgi:hypothetical protein
MVVRLQKSLPVRECLSQDSTWIRMDLVTKKRTRRKGVQHYLVPLEHNRSSRHLQFRMKFSRNSAMWTPCFPMSSVGFFGPLKRSILKSGQEFRDKRIRAAALLQDIHSFQRKNRAGKLVVMASR